MYVIEQIVKEIMLPEHVPKLQDCIKRCFNSVFKIFY